MREKERELRRRRHRRRKRLKQKRLKRQRAERSPTSSKRPTKPDASPELDPTDGNGSGDDHADTTPDDDK